MRTSFRLAAVTLVIAAGLSGSGCAPDAPEPKPAPSPSATPLFATDEEALAAAEEAYAAYLRVTDQVLADGGAGTERLREVATGAQLQVDIESAAETKSKGYRLTGKTTFDNMAIQQQNAEDMDRVIVAYACQDVSAIDILDATGRSVVSPTRVGRSLYEITFAGRVPADAGLLRVSSQTVWAGESC
jgi:hypothetical protein